MKELKCVRIDSRDGEKSSYLAISADGNRFVTGSQGGVVHMWEVRSEDHPKVMVLRRRQTREFKEAFHELFCVAVSPDGKWAFLWGLGRDCAYLGLQMRGISELIALRGLYRGRCAILGYGTF